MGHFTSVPAGINLVLRSPTFSDALPPLIPTPTPLILILRLPHVVVLQMALNSLLEFIIPLAGCSRRFTTFVFSRNVFGFSCCGCCGCCDCFCEDLSREGLIKGQHPSATAQNMGHFASVRVLPGSYSLTIIVL